MARAQNANIDFQGKTKPINIPIPVNPGDGTPKSWVEEQVKAIVKYVEEPVRAVATSNVNVASPGAELDGVKLESGNRVLLPLQAEKHANGTYIWHGPTEALTRTGDTFENGSAVVAGSDGATLPSTVWVQTTDNPIVGTTNITFINVGAISEAGAGLEAEGRKLKLASPVSIAHGGTAAATAIEALANLGGTGVQTTEVGNGALTSFTVAHTLHTGHPQVILVNNSTKAVEDCRVVYTSGTEVTLSGEAWEATPPASKAYTVVLIG